jgi:hypothetical protein
VVRMQAQLRPSEILAEIPKVQRQPVPQALQACAAAYGDQRTAMAAAYVSGADTLQAIAAYFGVHSSTVSRAVRWEEGQPAEQPCMLARPDPISMVCLCMLRWVLPHLDPHATQANQWRTIHPECINGCLTRWCQTDNFRGIVVPGEVIFPPLLLRGETRERFDL